MSLEIPNNLDLITNVKGGLEYRMQLLKDQIKILINKNKHADLKKKQFYDLLIQELNNEIQAIYQFIEYILKFLKENYDIEPEVRAI